MKTKIAIVLKIDTFIGDIREHLSEQFDVQVFRVDTVSDLEKAIIWGDVIWFEFCDNLFIQAINKNLSNFGKRVICRWHRYEITDMPYPNKVDWTCVDDLILVSNDMKRVMLEKVPDLEQKTRVSVVGNGLDFDRYAESDALDRFKIAWVAKPIIRKNPMMALQILHKLVTVDERYEMHFAGGFEPRIIGPHMKHIVERLGLQKNAFFNNWIEDMPAFYADKGIVLSTSVHESFGYNIAEGMAVGAFPAVYDYIGADEFWPDDIRFASVDRAAEMIADAELHQWRDYAVTHFGIADKLQELDAVIGQYARAA
ncbi:MAG: glycosyltransferase [Alphaproteobacteria bacterium]|jgi:glycosyltransferase involved in cell wall biosynthesis|nr:glycosyltransferase [Alphaproteobacteria bacterium]MDP7223055.1 glycosyltransferase [Alphaproteobacteria bacterium]